MGKQYTTAPILVNSNGDPIPQYLDITDKTDSPQGTFKPLTNETIQKVQLTGSNVEQILMNRTIRTNSPPPFFITPPDGVRGCMVNLTVFGVTGTFGNNEGVRLNLFWRQNKNSTSNAFDLGNVETSYTTNSKSHSILFYPDANLGDIRINSGNLKIVGLPVFGTLRIQINIIGTFSDGEGIDCQLSVQWLH